MRLKQQLLTQNDCYRVRRTIQPKGVMVHSTGANNPKVSRYVPGNSEIGKNSGNTHWNKSGIDKCVHAFIGKFADGKVGTVQTLPWNARGWHAGKGKKGSANNTHISFEICEDSLTDPTYFQKTYLEAVELTAYLCKMYSLDPLADGVVICHQEGYRRGIASNHGDVFHWWTRFNKSMDDFRADVAKILKGEDETVTYEQWKEFMDRYEKERGALPASNWAKPYIQKAIDAGAFVENGAGSIDRPRSYVTREELATVIVQKK